MAQLARLIDEHRNVKHAVVLKVTKVGRSPESAVMIDHPIVSREHFEITLGWWSGYRIRDLGSKFGTFLNGKRLTGKRTIRDGDCIMIACFQTEDMRVMRERAQAFGGKPDSTIAVVGCGPDSIEDIPEEDLIIGAKLVFSIRKL